MGLRGRKIIEPTAFRAWWRGTSNNASIERSDEIFEMVKDIWWYRMDAGREFDPEGLNGEQNKGKMIKKEYCDPDYQYYYYGNDSDNNLFILFPRVIVYEEFTSSYWILQGPESAGWSLGLYPNDPSFYAALNYKRVTPIIHK
jgi:hypothetical protein